MTTTITARNNQNMQDLILQACGTLEGAIAFCHANGVSISDTPVAGNEYMIPNEIDTDESVLQYLADKGIVLATLNTVVHPVLTGYRIILKPVMVVFFLQDETFIGERLTIRKEGSVNEYDLQVDFLSDNKLNYIRKNGYLTHPFDSLVISPFNEPTAPEAVLIYDFIGPASEDDAIMWNGADGNATITFMDVNGNKAVWSPLIAYHVGHTGDAQALIADMEIEQLGHNDGNLVVKVTKTHPDSAYDNIVLARVVGYIDNIQFALTGIADPDDPHNTTKRILELSPGVHRFDLVGEYTTTDGLHAWPQSIRSIIIEVY